MFQVPVEFENKQALLSLKLKEMREHNVFSCIKNVNDLQKFMECFRCMGFYVIGKAITARLNVRYITMDAKREFKSSPFD